LDFPLPICSLFEPRLNNDTKLENATISVSSGQYRLTARRRCVGLNAAGSFLPCKVECLRLVRIRGSIIGDGIGDLCHEYYLVLAISSTISGRYERLGLVVASYDFKVDDFQEQTIEASHDEALLHYINELPQMTVTII
jgi:hypothetical protein